MFGARSRLTAACAVVLTLAACHGSGSPSSLASSVDGKIDTTRACAAIAALRASGDALNGVDVSDPDAAQAALTKAVDAYAATLLAFERVGPASLRANAEAVRKAVVAHHFAKAVIERAALDTWATKNCS